MDRFNFGRKPTYGSPGASTTNPWLQFAGNPSLYNPNLRPGMPGYGGDMRPPSPPAQITDTSVISGEWELPKPPTGRDALGIAAKVKGAIGGNRSAFGANTAAPMAAASPAAVQRPTGAPDPWQLGNDIRSRVQGQTQRSAPTNVTDIRTRTNPGSVFGQTTTSRTPGTVNGVPQGPQPPTPPQAKANITPFPTQPASTAQQTPPQQQQAPPTGPTTPDGGYYEPAAPAQPTTGSGTLGSYGNASIDQWDDAFIAAGSKYGVDPTLLKAMMEIESGGDGNLPLDWCRADGSCGPMQIKPEYWGASSSVPDQIDKAAKILDDAVEGGQYATHRDALFGIYFPTDDVMNGTSQGAYGARVDELQAQMGASAPAAAPMAATPVETAIDPTAAAPVPSGGTAAPAGGDWAAEMTGGTTALGEIDYGFGAQAPDYAIANGYYADYGDWDETKHPGTDVYNTYGADIVAPIGGVVTCGGTGVGSGSFDGMAGCAAFGDNVGHEGASGRIEVEMDNGLSVIFGHASGVNVAPGDVVTPGTVLGQTGWDDGQGGGHVHVEARVWCPGASMYTLVDAAQAMYDPDPVATYC